MISKNEIEKFFVNTTKELRGRGPDNVVVKIECENVNITIHGIKNQLESETVKYFPETEEELIELRRKVFLKKLDLNWSRLEELLCGAIIDSDIKYDYVKDKAELWFRIESSC